MGCCLLLLLRWDDKPSPHYRVAPKMSSPMVTKNPCVLNMHLHFMCFLVLLWSRTVTSLECFTHASVSHCTHLCNGNDISGFCFWSLGRLVRLNTWICYKIHRSFLVFYQCLEQETDLSHSGFVGTHGSSSESVHG